VVLEDVEACFFSFLLHPETLSWCSRGRRFIFTLLLLREIVLPSIVSWNEKSVRSNTEGKILSPRIVDSPLRTQE
jgi:hypothetical protein